MRKIKKLRSLKPSARKMRECSRVKQNKRVLIASQRTHFFSLDFEHDLSQGYFLLVTSILNYQNKCTLQMHWRFKSLFVFFMKMGHFYIQDLGENGGGGGTKGINVYFFLPKLLFLVMGHLWVDLKDKWHFEYNQG